MKKFLALALALVMVLALAACGGTGGTPDNGSTPAGDQTGDQVGAGKTIGIAMPTQSSERWINDGANMKAKLEALGYLRRETDRADRRQNNLYLTDEGKALAPEIRGYLGQWGKEITAGLQEEEKATLLALLTKTTGQAPKNP